MNRGKKLITVACAMADKTYTEVAECMGFSKQAFNYKMKQGKFSIEELDKIAKYLGGELEISIRFPDDNVIKG